MENSKLLTILVEVDEGTKTPFKAHNEILSLFSDGKSVVCGNCDGWGYTVDENGRRKDHCKEC